MCDKNPQKIREMFDEISPYYDRMNDLISFGLHNIIKYRAVKMLGIKQQSLVLDVCCGTGDFTRIINRAYKRTKVIGLDCSAEMLKIAMKKNPKQTFITGDCTNLGFGEGEFDFVTAGFGLRNIENRQKAVEEIHRILKDGGKFLHLDFGNKSGAGTIFDFIAPLIVKISGKNLKNYEYLVNSKNSYPAPEELIKEFQDCGFEFIERKDFLFGALSAVVMRKN